MSWQEALGMKGTVFGSSIDAYFLKLGFYESTMNPRFFDGVHYNQIKEDAPVLRFDGDWDWDGNGVQRVFMNKREVYVERQTSYRSFDGSCYHRFDKIPTTVAEIEQVLDEIVRKYDE